MKISKDELIHRRYMCAKFRVQIWDSVKEYTNDIVHDHVNACVWGPVMTNIHIRITTVTWDQNIEIYPTL